MRLDVAVLAALVAPALGDSLSIITICNTFGICGSDGTWHASNVDYKGLNFNEGCRSFPIHAFQRVCFDWDNRRAHFYFSGQNKRCLKETSVEEYSCAGSDRCWRHTWSETRCTW